MVSQNKLNQLNRNRNRNNNNNKSNNKNLEENNQFQKKNNKCSNQLETIQIIKRILSIFLHFYVIDIIEDKLFLLEHPKNYHGCFFYVQLKKY